ncbi:cysteine desulfurase family protein [Acidithrix ferrooxidans]|uniref:cysteine desulfurase n=1 Tax=Acidithrix ferrooxidans TaxID=1280514 RepID=A0A0D8HDW2_9ACTN|nr:aminotransferase class V-fold PLP-dependent enzyme [Acidithrix ferrooxidans]KJF16150.1 cysteine desulfurase IscS [Acidithrix ferrooxidans]
MKIFTLNNRLAAIDYLDANASTPIHPRVLEAMREVALSSYGNPSATENAFGWVANQRVERCRSILAELTGSFEDEIIFTSGATEANNLFLLGFMKRVSTPFEQLLISQIEHPSVLEPARRRSVRDGIPLEQLRVDGQGGLDLEYFETICSRRRPLVSVILVNNEIGTIQDLGAISEIVRKYGGFLHVDASQAPATMDLGNVGDLCDAATFSAHKAYGPKGIGFLYLRQDHHSTIEPLTYGGGQQQGLRPGTIPTELIVGLTEAISLSQCEDGIEVRNVARTRRDEFEFFMLKEFKDIQVNGNLGNRHVGTSSISFSNLDASLLLGALSDKVAASSGSACSSGSIEPSHVLQAIGKTRDESFSTLRFGFHGLEPFGDVKGIVNSIVEATLNQR